MTEVTIELEELRELAYEKLKDQLGEEVVDGHLDNLVKQELIRLYDNRDEIEQQMEQQQGDGPLQQ